MGLASTTEGAIRLAIKAVIVLLVENEDDTLVTDTRHLVGFDTIISNHLLCVSLSMVQTIDGLEGLPHTGVVHIVEYRIGVLCRTAALEVHTADVLTTLYPTTGEVGELGIEIVISTVTETTLSRIVLIVLGCHQDF